MEKRRKSSRGWKHLSHLEKRLIAKRIVAGVSPREIAVAYGISLTTVAVIRKGYVIRSLSERFPDVSEEEGYSGTSESE